MNSENLSLFSLGEQALKEGRLEDAERAFRGALDSAPDEPEALYLLGIVQLGRGRVQNAVDILGAAADAMPRRGDVQRNLGIARLKAGWLQEAVDALEKSVELQPTENPAWKLLGDCLVEAGEPKRALPFYQTAVEQRPGDFQGRLALGKTLSSLGQWELASPHLERAVDLRPASTGVGGVLAMALYRNGDTDRALQVADEEATRSQDRDATALLCAALCHLDAARPAATLACLERLEKAGGSLLPAAVSARVSALNMLGETEQAVVTLRQTLSSQSNAPALWHDLARLAPERINNRDIKEMMALRQDLAPAPRSRLHFALAEVMEYRKRWHDQLELLEKANAIRARIQPYRADLEEQRHSRALSLFSPEFLERARGHGDSSVSPLFILGMPRSGTTLVEQILSSHSAVEAAGENLGVQRAFRTVESESGMQAEEALAASPSRWLPLFAEAYLHHLRSELALRGTCFTDKTLFLHPLAGLMQAAFPRARFIAMQRHPMDLCFAMYKQLFLKGQSFTNDFRSCAHALSLYLKSLEHARLMPELALMTLSYEDLVADQAGCSRRLLEHCGLAWEEQVLDFQDNARRVATLSVNQVNQRLYDQAVGRWRRYGEGLTPLREALREEGVALPD